MTAFVQVLISGLILGVLYALVGGGLNLIFGVFEILNVAHGEFIFGGAFITWFLWHDAGWNPLLTLPISAAAMFVVGVVLQLALIERVLSQAAVVSMILLFGVSLAVQGLGVHYFSVSSRTVDYFHGSWNVFGSVDISKSRLIAAAVALPVLLAVHVYLAYTRLGIATKATAQNASIAEACGINARLVRLITMGIATGMAGIAGSLLILIFGFNPQSGFEYAIIGFVVAVVGGLGSYYGSLLAALVLGVGQGLVSYYGTSELSTAVSYLFLILVLMVRPAGLWRTTKAVAR